MRIGWGLGSLPGSALSVTANVLLLRFMTDTLGMAAALAGSLFAVAKLWDAVVDPFIGRLTDRIRTPWGHRLPWILAGGLLSALVLVAAFAAPLADGTGLIVYMMAMIPPTRKQHVAGSRSSSQVAPRRWFSRMVGRIRSAPSVPAVTPA